MLNAVATHPRDLVKITSDKFSITRQATHRHLRNLINEQSIVCEGATRNKTYRLAKLSEWDTWFDIHPTLGEGLVWQAIVPQLGLLPENVRNIWQYGFTEMFNNVIDHSESKSAHVRVRKTAITTEIAITDFGVGIFRKIQLALGLADARHSVLELSKGKFTTDPTRHSGEGIFFSSRLFDAFRILAGDVFFSHNFERDEDWILKDGEHDSESSDKGTRVVMVLNNHTSRTTKEIMDQYADVDWGFTKTVVPVRLVQYGDDNLVSRSQAKRLLARFDRFRTVMLDFSGVELIGQAFADEVFRVFTNLHSDVNLMPYNCTEAVSDMIARVKATAAQPGAHGPGG
jgi:anti-sigma regulatory factor (Ser/Thr protein kinase)